MNDLILILSVKSWPLHPVDFFQQVRAEIVLGQVPVSNQKILGVNVSEIPCEVKPIDSIIFPERAGNSFRLDHRKVIVRHVQVQHCLVVMQERANLFNETGICSNSPVWFTQNIPTKIRYNQDVIFDLDAKNFLAAEWTDIVPTEINLC